MKSILAILIVIFSASSFAGDILVGQYTYHFSERSDGGEYRSFHPLIGYDTGKYTVIAMVNSYDENSVLALRTFKRDIGRNTRAFAAAGVATGYYKYEPDTSYGKLTAVGYLGADIHPHHDRYGIVITVVPDGFIGVGLRFSIR